MPSYLKDSVKAHCSGCGACVQICPVNAIELCEDSDGFKYPKTDSNKCINCSKCFNVCPFENKGETADEQQQKFFAAKSNDDKTIKDSSSGGAFSEIVKAVCDENYAVFGVEIDKNLRVIHTFIEDKNDLPRLQKSKYVQSDTGDSFKKAKEFLNCGKKVIFAGTPCQIAGLKNYLGRDYDNLLCIDIVCHGVPSQKLFDKYISELGSELGSDVVSFTFRNKVNFNKPKKCNQKTVLIKTADGKETVKEVLQCEYFAAFHEALIYRDSCAQCPFANTARIGDITIADFWGGEKYYPDFYDPRGTSLIVFNNQKGLSYLEKIKARTAVIETDREKACKNNAQLRRPVRFHPNRDKFLELNKNNPFCYSVRECITIPSPTRLLLSKLASPLKKAVRKIKK